MELSDRKERFGMTEIRRIFGLLKYIFAHEITQSYEIILGCPLCLFLVLNYFL